MYETHSNTCCIGAWCVFEAQAASSNLTENDVRDIIKEYLVNENPEILISMSNNLRAKKLAEQANEDRTKIQEYKKELTQTAASPQIGNPKGSLQIIEFFDYNCRYCKQSAAFTALMHSKSTQTLITSLKSYRFCIHYQPMHPKQRWHPTKFRLKNI